MARIKGHLERVCRRTGANQLGGRSSSSKQWTNLLTCPTRDNEASETEVYILFNVRDVSAVSFRVSMRINGACLEMELDTAAAASVISEATYKRLWRDNERPHLEDAKVRLRTYTGETFPI